MLYMQELALFSEVCWIYLFNLISPTCYFNSVQLICALYWIRDTLEVSLPQVSKTYITKLYEHFSFFF